MQWNFDSKTKNRVDKQFKLIFSSWTKKILWKIKHNKKLNELKIIQLNFSFFFFSIRLNQNILIDFLIYFSLWNRKLWKNIFNHSLTLPPYWT